MQEIKVIAKNTLKTVKIQSRVIKLGLGVNKKNCSSYLGRQSVKTFLFLIYFEKMEQSFLKTKISFNRYYLRLFITPNSSL